MSLTALQVRAIVKSLNSLGRRSLLDKEVDELLSQIVSADDLVHIINEVEPSLDAARALYRVGRRVGGAAVDHARWLLAGAYSLEGLDDVAHAIEPRQQETGFIKRMFSEQ